MRDACNALGVPVVSGNVSFYNETDGRSIPPTPTDRAGRTARRRRPSHDAVVQERGRRHRPARSHARGVGGQRVPGGGARTGAWHAAVDRSGGGDAGPTHLPAADPRGPRALGARRLGRRLGGSPRRGCISAPAEPSAPRSRWRPRSGRMRGCSARVSRASCCQCAANTSGACATWRAPPRCRVRVLGEVRGKRLRIGGLIDVNAAELRRAWADALPRRMNG